MFSHFLMICDDGLDAITSLTNWSVKQNNSLLEFAIVICYTFERGKSLEARVAVPFSQGFVRAFKKQNINCRTNYLHLTLIAILGLKYENNYNN